MKDLSDLKKRAKESLDSQRGFFRTAADAITGREPKDSELADEMKRLQLEDQRAENLSLKREQELASNNENALNSRLEREYANKEMGLGTSLDPKLLNYAWTISHPPKCK